MYYIQYKLNLKQTPLQSIQVRPWNSSFTLACRSEGRSKSSKGPFFPGYNYFYPYFPLICPRKGLHIKLSNGPDN